MMQHKTENEAQTAAIASNLAPEITPGTTICLHGDLGAGKSVFARALIRNLCGNAELDVPSPTFTLVQEYDSSTGTIYHFDLYRLKNAEEVYELGWEDAIADGIALIEWPERLGHLMPSNTINIIFEISSNNPDHRIIEVQTP